MLKYVAWAGFQQQSRLKAQGKPATSKTRAARLEPLKGRV